MSDTQPVFSCDLGALSVEERTQRSALASWVAARVREIQELADGYAVRLDPDRAEVRDALDWVLLERRVAIEPDAAVLALARQLAAVRPVGMFTNNPLLLKRHIAAVFPAVAEIFGARAVFSSELGKTKPDPEAFRRLAARLAAAPAEILYFDDYPAYVAGARVGGLSAEHVDGAPGVRAGLAAHGVRLP
jgi:HAD superfamily hydrolase (TIGR01509 family)